MAHRGLRGPSNWRYRVIKGYKQRAEQFRDRSQTDEQRQAWSEVVSWFNSILKDNRIITPTGAIGLLENPIVGFRCCSDETIKILDVVANCNQTGEKRLMEAT